MGCLQLHLPQNLAGLWRVAEAGYFPVSWIFLPGFLSGFGWDTATPPILPVALPQSQAMWSYKRRRAIYEQGPEPLRLSYTWRMHVPLPNSRPSNAPAVQPQTAVCAADAKIWTFLVQQHPGTTILILTFGCHRHTSTASFKTYAGKPERATDFLHYYTCGNLAVRTRPTRSGASAISSPVNG
jgi:hypothetical protein